MLSETELLYTLALQRVPNLGDTSAKKLLLALGSAEAIFKEKKSNLLKIDGIGNLKIKIDATEITKVTEKDFKKKLKHFFSIIK